MYEDPNVDEAAETYVVRFATDPEHDSVMRRPFRAAVTELAERFGYDLDVHEEDLSEGAQPRSGRDWFVQHSADLSAVEQAWYDETKGELCVEPLAGEDFDEDLAGVVVAMMAEARQYTSSVDADQGADAEALAAGGERERQVLGRRVAEALALLHFGRPDGSAVLGTGSAELARPTTSAPDAGIARSRAGSFEDDGFALWVAIDGVSRPRIYPTGGVPDDETVEAVGEAMRLKVEDPDRVVSLVLDLDPDWGAEAMEDAAPTAMVARFDVTGLTADQRGSLETCVSVQAERVRPGEETEAGHPDVPVEITFVREEAIS